MSEKPKTPWGGGDEPDKEPRNPWSVPPAGSKCRPGPSALDEFLRRARATRPGGGGGGNGPGGGRPSARSLWAGGAAAILLLWVFFTSLHQIAPQERGIVLRFGRYIGQLDPGVSLTLPAPIETVRKFNVQYLSDSFPQAGGENLMLTGDGSVVDLGYTVNWSIVDPKGFAFQLADPKASVRAVAESAMRAVIAKMSFDHVVATGRYEIESGVQQEMQRILDGYGAGVRVQAVSINRAAAPSRIAEAFNEVTSAQQKAISARNDANTYAEQKIALAQGDAGAFDREYEQYKLAPEVYRRRLYYETMEAVLAKNNKVVVGAPNVLPYMNLPQLKRLPDAATPGAEQ